MTQQTIFRLALISALLICLFNNHEQVAVFFGCLVLLA